MQTVTDMLTRLLLSPINGDRLFKEISMALRTIGEVLSNPAGTARLLEAHSTLKRAQDARLTYEQICTVFPDAAKYSSAQLEGFMLIGADLVAGRTRFSGRLLSQGGKGVPEPI